MPQWDNSQQGTPGWLKARLGCLTASRMADAMAHNKKGEPLEARKKYQFELIAERMTDTVVDRYVTPAMEHGIVTEPLARARYEETTGLLVDLCGFAMHDDIEYCGASPDGLIGHDGLLEIKCPTTHTHLAYKMAGVPPVQYHPQMILQLLVTDRSWCDFVSFDHRVPESAQLLITRFTPAPEQLAEVEDHARRFLLEVELMWDQFVSQT